MGGAVIGDPGTDGALAEVAWFHLRIVSCPTDLLLQVLNAQEARAPSMAGDGLEHVGADEQNAADDPVAPDDDMVLDLPPSNQAALYQEDGMADPADIHVGAEVRL